MRLLILLLCLPMTLFCQPPTDRYQVELFGVTEINDVTFSTGVPQPNAGGGFYEFVTGFPLNVDEYSTTPVDLKMDIFMPAGDTLQKRPLVIVCFGGGFLSGSRDHWSIRLICQELAKRGYVAASIDYRLGMNIFDSDLANRAVYRGLQDARSAVRFFRADADNANIYKIDTDHIFIGGHSSGGFMALHNAYLNKEIERPLSTYEWIQDNQIVPDQGCIDCAGDNLGYSGHANGTFSLAGALGFTSFIESSTDPKSVLFHSTDDGTVPYDSGEPFSSILWLVVGSDLPDVYGSLPISQQCASVDLPYDFFSYTDREHDVHEDGSSSLYSDIIPGISDWFFEEEVKPQYSMISGDTVVCSDQLIRTYKLPAGEGNYFDWQITGGAISSPSVYSDQVTVEWDENAGDHEVMVTAYNHLDAKGDVLSLSIDLQQSDINNLEFQDSDWSNPLNWSLNHSPTACEDVFLNAIDIPIDLVLTESTEINSLHIDESITLILNNDLKVHQKIITSPQHVVNLQGKLTNNSILVIANNALSTYLNISNMATLNNVGELALKK